MFRPAERTFPHTRWVRDRRYVRDADLFSTTGVTASDGEATARFVALQLEYPWR